MTKAEQLRWSTWTNALGVLTIMKKFYADSCVELKSIKDDVTLSIAMFTGTYNLEELLNDLDKFCIEDTSAEISTNEIGSITQVIVHYKLESHDN